MDPVDALNRMFRDPADLSARVEESRRYAAVCRDYVALQLAERPDPTDATKLAESAPSQLQDLIVQSNEIQAVGRQTLDRVKDATNEIRRLDNTKENLTASIRMLRQLRMLSKLYGQLDALLKERRYEDMAGAVEAASDLIDYFRPFRPLPQVAQLSKEIGAMESKIYDQIQADFTSTVTATNGDTTESTPETLRAACVVLDSLDGASGKKTSRERLIKWYCDYIMAEYNRIFAPGDEAGSLENVTPRYNYLKRKVYDKYLSSHAQYFAPSWPVQSELVKRIAERTASDLVFQISQLQNSQSEHIQMLLITIQESKAFESYTRSPSVISAQLLPYLSLWVQFQDRQLTSRIMGYSRALTPIKEEDEVIPSSREFVNYYRALLSQLDKVEHGEETTAQLAEVMARNLGRFATRVLVAYLPEGGLRTSDFVVAGRVVATADYFKANILKLQAQLSSQLKNSELTDEAFETQAMSRYRQLTIRVEEMFSTLVARTLEPLWGDLAVQYNQLRGSNLDVSHVSPYISALVEVFNNILSEIFHAAPTPSVIYNVGLRATDAVCIGFLTTAMARITKPVNETQPKQMLLDIGEVKKLALKDMVKKAPKDVMEKKGAERLAQLDDRLMKMVARVEEVLKVLIESDNDNMDKIVDSYLLLIKDRSTRNFRKILDVKGIRFQNRAIEKFKIMVQRHDSAGEEPKLDDENPLLTKIPLVAQPLPSQYEVSNGSGFAINNIRRIGEFLRRDHQ